MMADFMPIPLCETDVHLNIVYANKAALNWFGSKKEALVIGIPLSKILVEPGIRNFAQLSRHLKRTSEFLIKKRDGSRVWAQIEMAPDTQPVHAAGPPDLLCGSDPTKEGRGRLSP